MLKPDIAPFVTFFQNSLDFMIVPIFFIDFLCTKLGRAIPEDIMFTNLAEATGTSDLGIGLLDRSFLPTQLGPASLKKTWLSIRLKMQLTTFIHFFMWKMFAPISPGECDVYLVQHSSKVIIASAILAANWFCTSWTYLPWKSSWVEPFQWSLKDLAWLGFSQQLKNICSC